MIKYILPIAIIIFLIVLFWEKITEIDSKLDPNSFIEHIT